MGKTTRVILLVLLCCFTYSAAYAGELVLKPKGVSQWETYDPKKITAWDMFDKDGAPAGVLQKTKEGNFEFYNSQGTYMGIILQSWDWMPKRGTAPRIAPEDAMLYLDVLDAVKNLDQ